MPLSIALFFALFLPADVGHAAAPPSLILVDDRQEEIQAPLEVCFFSGLERSCVSVESGMLAAPLPPFDLLTVEGPRHGPMTLRSGELARKRQEPPYRAEVARKARLSVHRLPPEPEDAVTLSLYRQDDPLFRRPVGRWQVREAEDLWIPAGGFLASLSSRGRAPDLHLLDVLPGSTQTLTFRAREGWSLVLRAVSQDARRPIAGATVEVTAAPGYEGGGAGSAPRSAVTGGGGLAVFSGLSQVIASLAVEREGYLAGRVPAVASSPASFAFEEAGLARGGWVRIEVTRDGEPAVEVPCELLSFDRDEANPFAAPEVLSKGRTDGHGVFETGRVAEGSYTVRLLPEGTEAARRARVDRSVAVLEEQETPLGVELMPIEVGGTVYRGTHPAIGMKIVVHPSAGAKPMATAEDAVALASTDEEGHFELTLWTPGEYYFGLRTPASTPAGDSKITYVGPAGKSLDFHLGEQDIRGIVLDGSGRGVEGARVQLIWQRHQYRLAVTAEDGVFAFPVADEEGPATLQAFKSGRAPSEPVEIIYTPGGELTPVTLVLDSEDTASGRLLGANGTAIAGGWVMSYRISPPAEPLLVGLASTDAQGRFELTGADEGGRVRLFFAGPGCPLGVRNLGARAGAEATAQEPVDLVCAALPASLEVRLQDADGGSVEGAQFLLGRSRTAFPREVLATHLFRMGLPARTDGSGRWVLVALEPGDYELYLATASNGFTIEQGLPNGLLTNAHLTPGATASVELTLDGPGAR